MLELTFGEQVKVVLNRKGMTIKQLAELIEAKTGKKMSRQNLTQRLSRDNFQEQDMRMIAGMLGCPLHLSILEDETAVHSESRRTEEKREKPEEKKAPVSMQANERDITIGELLDINEALDSMASKEREAREDYTIEELLAEVDALEKETAEEARMLHGEEGEKDKERKGWRSYLQRHLKPEDGREEAPEASAKEAEGRSAAYETVQIEEETVQIEGEMVRTEDGDYPEDLENGEVNPYTGREYRTNSVRMHPNRIGYVQVYDRGTHRWTDMTEWAFLGYQERKKELLGKDYEPPVYLD